MTVSGSTVTLTAENLEAENVAIEGGNYQLAMTGVTAPPTTAASFDGTTYKSASISAGYTLANNEIKYAAAIPAKNFTLTNLNSRAKLGENLLVTDDETTSFKFKAAALDKKSVTITGGKFSVAFDSDVDTTAETISESKVLTNSVLNYRAAGTGEYYTATAAGVTFNAQTGGETFTLTGIKNADGVTISGGTVTVNETALDMTATASYTVALSGDAYALNFTANTSTAEVAATLQLHFGLHASAFHRQRENLHVHARDGSDDVRNQRFELQRETRHKYFRGEWQNYGQRRRA